MLLGKYNTKASRDEYTRVIAEWNARGTPVVHADITVNELLVLYHRHVAEHYRHADGSPTSEVANIKAAVRWLKELYGMTVAKKFTTLGLEAIQSKMIEHGLCRNRINKDTARIRRCFKWAGAKLLVDAAVYHQLRTLDFLKAGRSAARETEAVKPVPLAVVDATIPFMPPTVADMTRLQLTTGMRSGELIRMRSIDIDMTGPVWHYSPVLHKTAHRGKERTIAIGPIGQQIIRRYLKTNLQAPLFSPRESVEQFRATLRQQRKTKVQPSQANRKKRHPKRVPGEQYTVTGYAQSIGRAVRRANAAALKANPENPVLIPHWHPHQLRHTRATELRRQYGIEAARVILGHSSPKVTEGYAERDLRAADDIMAKIG
jgi:integrase